MSQIQFAIADFTQTSTWTASWYEGEGETYLVYSTPSTDTDTKAYDISTLPAGAIIDSALLAQARNDPWTGISLRQIDGVAWTGSKDVTAQMQALGGVYTTLSFAFKFKANGGAGGAGTRTSTLSLTANTLTVNYHMPTSTGTLDKATVNAGEDISVTITPAESGRTHKALWSFGAYSSDSGILSTATLTHTLSVPMSWLNAIPNAISGIANCRLETYDGGTLLGYVDYPFTIACPGSVVPSLTFNAPTHIPYNGTVAAWGYIQGKSKASMAISSAQGAYGSTISSYNIIGGGYDSGAASSLETGYINSVGTVTFTARVTDSRGRTKTETQSVNFQAYVKPWFISTIAQRCTSGGVLDIAGTYALVYAVFDKTAIGTNSVSGTVSYKENSSGVWSAPAPITSGSALVIGSGDFNVGKTYSIKLTIADALDSTEYYEYISISAFLLEASASGKRLGLLSAYGDEDDTIKCGGWIIAPTGEKIGVPSNPNLLVNSDFSHWPRGAGPFTSGYGPSRWGTFDSPPTSFQLWGVPPSAVAVPYCLCVAASNGTFNIIGQPISRYAQLEGKKVTLSFWVLAPAGKLMGYGIGSTNNEILFYGTGGWQFISCTTIFTAGSAIREKGVRFYSGVGQGNFDYFIAAVKLELGSVATPYVPPDEAANVQEGQRYFYKVGGMWNATAWSADYAWVSIPFPAKMRLTPSLTVAESTYFYPGVGYITPNSVSYTGYESADLAVLQFTPNPSYPFVTNGSFLFRGTLLFDAEMH